MKQAKFYTNLFFMFLFGQKEHRKLLLLSHAKSKMNVIYLLYEFLFGNIWQLQGTRQQTPVTLTHMERKFSNVFFFFCKRCKYFIMHEV